MNICTVTSNYSYGRQYQVATKSAMTCAKSIGRCESGEKITVTTKSGKVLSQVAWIPDDGGKYIRVNTGC